MGPRVRATENQLADVSSLAGSLFSFAGSPLARTPEIFCRICRTRTPSEISNSIWSSSTTLVTLPTSPPEVTTVSPRRIFFTSSAWSFTFFCCGRRIRKYMITKISANGSSDINMLLVSLPPAAWANAGVISIRTILVKRESTGNAFASRRFGQIRADYSGRGPNCNAARPLICPSFEWLAASCQAQYGATLRNFNAVEKTPQNPNSPPPHDPPPQTTPRPPQTPPRDL